MLHVQQGFGDDSLLNGCGSIIQDASERLLLRHAGNVGEVEQDVREPVGDRLTAGRNKRCAAERHDEHEHAQHSS